MKKINYYLAMSIIVINVSGCAVFDYGAFFNKRAETMQLAQTTSQTSFVVRQHREAKNCTDGMIRDPKRNKDVLVLLRCLVVALVRLTFRRYRCWRCRMLSSRLGT